MLTIVLICVFFSVALLAFSFYTMGQTVMAERQELVRQQRKTGMVFADPMERFISPSRLMQVRFSLAAGVAAVVVCMLMFAGAVGGALGVLVPAAVLAGAAYMVPVWWFRNKVKARNEQFEDSILELTMGLEKGLRGGQALAQAIESMSRRIEGPMREELEHVFREMHMGKDIVEAMERLQVRMPCEDLQLLVTAIRLTTKSGGSMADVLMRMTEMIRGRREFQGKLATLTAQGRFEALAIICAPWAAFCVLYMLNTELMRPMLFCTTGWLAFAAVAALEIIGWLIIKRIVTIEV